MAGEATASRGPFITVEGIEGCGKTTQIARLERRLRRAGVELLVTREPGGTSLGRALRRILLDPSAPRIDPASELLLYTADRAQHASELLVPALERGELVLCDRYLDATLAYQGHGRGLDVESILALHARPPLDLRPTRTVLLDLDPAIGLGRARRRDAARRGPDEGRFEAETLEFHRRVRDGYLALSRAEPARFRVVDASGEPDAVERRIVAALAGLIPASEATAP